METDSQQRSVSYEVQQPTHRQRVSYFCHWEAATQASFLESNSLLQKALRMRHITVTIP